jgi:hypothetical protein
MELFLFHIYTIFRRFRLDPKELNSSFDRNELRTHPQKISYFSESIPLYPLTLNIASIWLRAVHMNLNQMLTMYCTDLCCFILRSMGITYSKHTKYFRYLITL